MERAARAALRREGFRQARQSHTRTIAARYRGQSFELEIEWSGGRRLVARCRREHEARYGYAQSAGAIEVVSARLRSAGLVESLKDERTPRAHAGRRAVAPPSTARVHFDEGPRETVVYRREDLHAGARLRAPCVVTEYSSTTLIPTGARAATDARGNLVIEL